MPLVAGASESDKLDSKGAQILCGGRELLADHVEEFQLKGFGLAGLFQDLSKNQSWKMSRI